MIVGLRLLVDRRALLWPLLGALKNVCCALSITVIERQDFGGEDVLVQFVMGTRPMFHYVKAKNFVIVSSLPASLTIIS